MKYSFQTVARNPKTGPISTSMTSQDSCPPSCALMGEGCYAEKFPTVHWWRQVGLTLDDLCDRLKRLPKGYFFRHNVAGDLPGEGEKIDMKALAKLMAATRHLVSWTYTHKRDLPLIRAVNLRRRGMVINLSADSLEEADALAKHGPVCLVGDHRPGSRTPEGRLIAICPAVLSKDTTCFNCGNGAPLCARKERNYIIGFWKH